MVAPSNENKGPGQPSNSSNSGQSSATNQIGDYKKRSGNSYDSHSNTSNNSSAPYRRISGPHSQAGSGAYYRNSYNTKGYYPTGNGTGKREYESISSKRGSSSTNGSYYPRQKGKDYHKRVSSETYYEGSGNSKPYYGKQARVVSNPESSHKEPQPSELEYSNQDLGQENNDTEHVRPNLTLNTSQELKANEKQQNSSKSLRSAPSTYYPGTSYSSSRYQSYNTRKYYSNKFSNSPMDVKPGATNNINEEYLPESAGPVDDNLNSGDSYYPSYGSAYHKGYKQKYPGKDRKEYYPALDTYYNSKYHYNNGYSNSYNGSNSYNSSYGDHYGKKHYGHSYDEEGYFKYNRGKKPSRYSKEGSGASSVNSQSPSPNGSHFDGSVKGEDEKFGQYEESFQKHEKLTERTQDKAFEKPDLKLTEKDEFGAAKAIETAKVAEKLEPKLIQKSASSKDSIETGKPNLVEELKNEKRLEGQIEEIAFSEPDFEPLVKSQTDEGDSEAIIDDKEITATPIEEVALPRQHAPEPLNTKVHESEYSDNNPTKQYKKAVEIDEDDDYNIDSDIQLNFYEEEEEEEEEEEDEEDEYKANNEAKEETPLEETIKKSKIKASPKKHHTKLYIDVAGGCIFPMNRLEQKLFDLKNRPRNEIVEYQKFLFKEPISDFESDYAFFNKNVLIDEQAVKPRLLKVFQNAKKQIYFNILTAKKDYQDLKVKWDKKCEANEKQLAKLYPEYQAQFDSEFKKTEENQVEVKTPSSSSSNRRSRLHVADSVTSEAEFEKILQQIKMNDPLYKAEMQAATIPEMIMDPVVKYGKHFIDINNLVLDKTRFTKRLKTDPIDNFTKEEHKLFVEAYVANPKKFGKIAQAMGGLRTYQDCVKHYYNTKRTTNYKQMVLNKRTRRINTRRKGGKTKNANKKVEEKSVSSTPVTEIEVESETDKAKRTKVKVIKRQFSEVEESDNNEVAPDIRRKRTPKPRKDLEKPPPVPVEKLQPQESILQVQINGNTHVSEENKPEEIILHSDNRPKPVSSYWSVAEISLFPKLLEKHGTQWDLIAKEMGSKTTIMVRNYYSKNAYKESWRETAEKVDKDRHEKALENFSQRLYANPQVAYMKSEEGVPPPLGYFVEKPAVAHSSSLITPVPQKTPTVPLGVFYNKSEPQLSLESSFKPLQKPNISSILNQETYSKLSLSPEVSRTSSPKIASLISRPVTPRQHGGSKASIFNLLNNGPAKQPPVIESRSTTPVSLPPITNFQNNSERTFPPYDASRSLLLFHSVGSRSILNHQSGINAPMTKSSLPVLPPLGDASRGLDGLWSKNEPPKPSHASNFDALIAAASYKQRQQQNEPKEDLRNYHLTETKPNTFPPYRGYYSQERN